MLLTGNPQIDTLIGLGLLLVFFGTVAALIINRMFPSPGQLKDAVTRAKKL